MKNYQTKLLPIECKFSWLAIKQYSTIKTYKANILTKT